MPACDNGKLTVYVRPHNKKDSLVTTDRSVARDWKDRGYYVREASAEAVADMTRDD